MLRPIGYETIMIIIVRTIGLPHKIHFRLAHHELSVVI
jgi:hypothetical protein